jgi:olfactory receptor
METENNTRTSAFFLLGFSKEQIFQGLLLRFFHSMYLITVIGNLLIILATISDFHLHKPMYIFLSSLSFVDINFISTTIPKMLVNIQMQCKDIIYECCMNQM